MTNKTGSKSAQVAEPSKTKKGATPAQSTTKASGKSEAPKKAKVKEATTKAVAEATKARVLLYHYPEIVAEGKTEGERQSRKKKFRQEMRSKIKSLTKAYKKAKLSKDEGEIKTNRVALKNFAKTNLTSDGIAKHKLNYLFEKKEKVS